MSKLSMRKWACHSQRQQQRTTTRCMSRMRSLLWRNHRDATVSVAHVCGRSRPCLAHGDAPRQFTRGRRDHRPHVRDHWPMAEASKRACRSVEHGSDRRCASLDHRTRRVLVFCAEKNGNEEPANAGERWGAWSKTAPAASLPPVPPGASATIGSHEP
jgi:hypothetical protein